MSAHTPGPWNVGTIRDRHPDGIYTEAKNAEGDGEERIALVYGIWSNASVADAEGDARCAAGLANAHLIASAPDLLNSLDWLVGEVESWVGCDSQAAYSITHSRAFAVAKRAIAKARNEGVNEDARENIG